MKKKSKVKNAMVLTSALLILAGLFYGCYSKGVGAEKSDSYGKAVKQEPLSEETIAKFMDSVRIVDGEAEAHYKLALYFQEKWRHKLAIDELKQVLMRNPVHAKAYNALGVSHDNLGDHEAAIDYYKLALNIDSKLDFVYNNLGYSYLLRGDNHKAVEAFQQAIALNSKEKRYRNNLGLAYAKQDEFELAFEQLRALDTDANAKKTLARVMQDLGKGSQTQKVLLAIQSAPKVEPLPAEVESVSRLPELAAVRPESGSEINPVERFRSVNRSVSLSSNDHIESATEAAENTEQSEAVEEEGVKKKKDVLAEVQAETLLGPVINLPKAAKQSSDEMKISSAQLERNSNGNEVKNEKPAEYYHVSSVAFSHDSLQIAKPASAEKSKMVVHEKPVAKENRAVLPPKFGIASKMNTEEQEERILLASSSTKAGGWQNAPEPKQTAEKGLIAVEVANGNGVKGAAAKVAGHLRSSGFRVVKVMDANSFDHFSTKVFYYGGSVKEVQRILKAIPEITNDAELYELEKMGNHIRLLIGKDLVERNSSLTWNKPRDMSSRIGG